jgi:hypothetical protein
MKALKLLTGLVPSAGSVSDDFSSEFSVSGSGGGTLFEIDFFLRRKNAEDFLVTTGWFSLLAEVSVEVRRTGRWSLLGGVLGWGVSSGTGVDRPCCGFVGAVCGVGTLLSGFVEGFFDDPNTRRKKPGRETTMGSWKGPIRGFCSRAAVLRLGTLFMEGNACTGSPGVLIALVPNGAGRPFLT